MSLRALCRLAATVLTVAAVTAPAQAQTDYYWNAPTGGDGTWGTATPGWSTLAAGPVNYTWTNSGSERANFGNAAGNVSLGTTITAHSLVFSTDGYVITGNTLTLAGTGGVVNTGSFGATIDSAVAGSVGLTKNGSGTLALGGANTYTGVTAVSAGVVSITNASSLGAVGAGNHTTVTAGAAVQIAGGITVAEAITLNNSGVAGGGALRNTAGDNTWNGAITLASATRINSDAGTLTIATGGITGAGQDITVGGAGNTTISAVIATNSNGDLTKDGAGTLTLTGANTYTGATTINGGVLSTNLIANGGLASGIGQSSTGAANLVLNGGTLQYTGTGATTNRLLTLGPNGGTIDASGAGNAALSFDNGTTTSQVTNSGSGARTLTLTGTSTGDNTFSLVLIDKSSTERSSLVKSGPGTWVLRGSNANSYTGGTTIAEGTLKISANNRLPTAGQLTVGSGSTSGAFDLNGFSQTVGGLASAGTGTANQVINTSGAVSTFTLTVNYAGGTPQTFAGRLGGGASNNNFGLTKNGAGTLVVTGDNTYTGVTNVNAGTLLLNNTSGSGTGTDAVTVNGGTLGGTGSIAGAVTVGTLGTVRGGAPGGTGTLTIANNLTLIPASPRGAVLQVEANRTNPNAADASRLVLTSGGVMAFGTSGIRIENSNKFGIDLIAPDLALNETYTIQLASVPGGYTRNGVAIDASGADYVFLTSDYTVSAAFELANVSLFIDQGTTNLMLTFTPVPEPGTVLLIAAAGLGAVGLARRRRARRA